MKRSHKKVLFQQEYSRLYDKIYRYVSGRVMNRPDAEDIVADTVVEGYRTIENYDETQGTLDQWMFGIARHRMIAHWKKLVSCVDLESVQEIIIDDVIDDVGRVTDLRLCWQKIMLAIPEELHVFITLRFSDGMSCEEISNATGKSPAAVRQLFSRLFRKLRADFPELNEALV